MLSRTAASFPSLACHLGLFIFTLQPVFFPFTITTEISTNQAPFQQGIEDLIQNQYFISIAAAQVYFDRGPKSLVREGQQAGMATGQQ